MQGIGDVLSTAHPALLQDGQSKHNVEPVFVSNGSEVRGQDHSIQNRPGAGSKIAVQIDNDDGLFRNYPVPFQMLTVHDLISLLGLQCIMK